MATVYYHDPDAVLDYGKDWSEFLDGDTISTSEWAVSGTGLTIDSDTISGDTAIVWLSGGTSGMTYTLTNSIVTTAGREEDAILTIYVRDKYPALVIEDGSLVDGANSYATVTEYMAYAESRGVSLADNETSKSELVQAIDYMESKRPQFKGSLVDRDQPLGFPRYDVVIEGFYWESDEIPRQVKLCQLALALDIHAGNDPYNPEINSHIKSERIDEALTLSYFGRDQDVKLSKTSKWEALLSSLLVNSGLGIALERA